MHQVGRLDDECLDAVLDGSFQGLLDVVDLLAVTRLNMVDDDLSGESSAYGPVRIRLGKSVFDALDVGGAAVVEGSTEGYYQELLLADAVLVERIVLACVAGVASEVIRICLFAFNKLFLLVGEGVPCGLCGCALLVGLFVPFLNVDGVDELGNIVCCFLVLLGRRACGQSEDHGEHQNDGENYFCMLHLNKTSLSAKLLFSVFS